MNAPRNSRDLTPQMRSFLAKVCAAGLYRIAVRETRRERGLHGQRRTARPQFSDEPTAYRAECGGCALSIRTVYAVLSRGELVPLRRGWNICVRLRARDATPGARR